jgi:hypothetical protein
MNKYLYILGFAGAALFSACSTSDDLSIEESSAVDKAKESVLIFEAGQNSEVPISLGIGQSRGNTRAPIGGEGDPANPVSFSTELGKSLGVFCLATGYQSSYVDNPPIVNNWTDDDTGLIVRMKNVAATVTGGDISFNDHDYYYPIGNWMKYNFYTYYPRQEETVTIDGDDKKTIQFSNNQVLERFYEIDGSQDIIWGKADPSKARYIDAPNDAEPFSAGYYLWKKDNLEVGDDIANYNPQFSFEHKMVQFRFFVRADNIVASKNIRVRDMNITNGINSLALIVANKSNSDFDGKLYWFGKTIETKWMSIKLNGSDKKRFDQNGDGKLDSPLSITENAVDVNAVDGDGNPNDPSFAGYIMLAPPDVPKYNDRNLPEREREPNETVYRLVLKVRYDGGTSDKNVVRLLNPPEGGFKAGKIYNIVISITSTDLGI